MNKKTAGLEKIVHATALWWQGCGLILLGPSRSGKSDLALRLIYEEHAQLVGDDVCAYRPSDQGYQVRGDKNNQGLLEARGLGLVQLAPSQWISEAPLDFAVHLIPAQDIPEEPSTSFMEGTQIPLYPLDPFGASARARLKMLIAVTRRESALIWPHTPLPLTQPVARSMPA
jgi:HPr kinase/phosphorylase